LLTTFELVMCKLNTSLLRNAIVSGRKKFELQGLITYGVGLMQFHQTYQTTDMQFHQTYSTIYFFFSVRIRPW